MESSLPLHTILAELDDLGCTVTVKDGAPQVSRPNKDAHKERFAVLLRSLRARREEVIAHFANMGTPAEPCGTRCEECGGLVFTDSPEVQQLCHMLMCPLWKKDCGTGPEWMAKARNDERWKRGKG